MNTGASAEVGSTQGGADLGKSQESQHKIGACFKIVKLALTGVAQWVGRCPANQKVADSTPSQGMCLGCGPGPQLGACERQHIDVSLTHGSFLLPLVSHLSRNK